MRFARALHIARGFEPEMERPFDAKPAVVRRHVDESDSPGAAKAGVARARIVELDPGNAAKGERGNAMNGAITC